MLINMVKKTVQLEPLGVYRKAPGPLATALEL